MPLTLPPARDDLAAILRHRRGQLAETPYPLLLVAIASAQENAVLELRRGPMEKSIVFDSGSPVECRSNIATETLGRFLVAQGKLSDSDCHNALSTAASRGIPLGEVLTERKLLSPTELYRVLQQNLGRKLLEPFSWTTGTWEIFFDRPRVASALRVKTPQLIVTGIIKVAPQEQADAAAERAAGKFLSLAGDAPFPLEELRLSKEQQQVIDAARGASSYDELRAATADDPDDLHRILYALLLLGIVRLTDEPSIEVPPLVEDLEPAAVSSPAGMRLPEITPAAHEFTLPPPVRRAASPDEVMAAYLSYRRKDAFELLEVAETDGPAAFIRSFVTLSEKFHPANFESDSTDSLRDKAQEVFLGTARAYAELADPDRRETLVKRRATLREQQAAAAQRGTAALIDPEELYKSGRALAIAGKIREALGSFELAAECDAQNGTYAAEAAWCRYRLNVTPAPNALKMLKNAIRIDPNAGAAYLYAAHLQAILGHKVEAAGYLGRASSLMPGDPRLAEAARAIR